MRDLGSHTAYRSTVALRAETGDGYDVVYVAGQLDMNTFVFAKDQILAAPSLRQPLLLLDLGLLEFLDSSGIRALVLLHRGLTASRTRLAFVTDSTHLRKLFRISGLDQVVPVHSSVAEAVHESVHGPATGAALDPDGESGEEPASAG